jgi:hypothetical protein
VAVVVFMTPLETREMRQQAAAQMVLKLELLLQMRQLIQAVVAAVVVIFQRVVLLPMVVQVL